MFIDMFVMMLKMLWIFLKIPFFIFIGLVLLFFTICCAFFIYYYSKGKRIKKGQKRIYPKRSFLKKIFYDMPKRIILDMFDKEPDFFSYQGLVIFTGRQGRGKSMAMTEFARRMHYEYPLSKSISNLSYPWDNDFLADWQQLIDYKNGINGVIVAMDELQLFFSQRDSANFPAEMLGIITQNRKNRRIILGTAQSIHNLAKDIRAQATEVRQCDTLFGALTIVRRYEPYLDSDGNITELKYKGMYFFIQDKNLRNSYDTWKVAEVVKNKGFAEKKQEINITNNYTVRKKK